MDRKSEGIKGGQQLQQDGESVAAALGDECLHLIGVGTGDFAYSKNIGRGGGGVPWQPVRTPNSDIYNISERFFLHGTLQGQRSDSQSGLDSTSVLTAERFLSFVQMTY